MSQEGDLDAGLYRDNFDRAHSQQGDLELTGLNTKIDQREEKLRTFKARLEDWRPLALPVIHFLEWRQPWNPAVLVGMNTLFFILIWWLDFSVLSTLAVLGVLITFADGIVPILSTTIFATNSWTSAEEEEYDVLCNRLMNLSNCTSGFLTYINGVKAQLPRVFSIVFCGIFLFLAVFFDRVNNFFLMYLLTTLLILTPGLHAKGVVTLAHHHGKEIIKKIRNRKTTKQN